MNAPGWWEEVEEHDEAQLERKVGKALNLVSSMPGSEGFKRRALRQLVPLAEHDAAVECPPEEGRRRYNRKVCSLVIRYYRTAYRRNVASGQVRDHRDSYRDPGPPRAEGPERRGGGLAPVGSGVRGVVRSFRPREEPEG